jgi:hypothetical protein
MLSPIATHFPAHPNIPFPRFTIAHFGHGVYLAYLVSALALVALERYDVLLRLAVAQTVLVLFLLMIAHPVSSLAWAPTLLGSLGLIAAATSGLASRIQRNEADRPWTHVVRFSAAATTLGVLLIALLPTPVITMFLGRNPSDAIAFNALNVLVCSLGGILLCLVAATEGCESSQPFVPMASGIVATGLALLVKMRFGWRPFFGWPVPVVWEWLTIVLLLGCLGVTMGGAMGCAESAHPPRLEFAAQTRRLAQATATLLGDLSPSSLATLGGCAIVGGSWVAACWAA